MEFTRFLIYPFFFHHMNLVQSQLNLLHHNLIEVLITAACTECDNCDGWNLCMNKNNNNNNFWCNVVNNSISTSKDMQQFCTLTKRSGMRWKTNRGHLTIKKCPISAKFTKTILHELIKLQGTQCHYELGLDALTSTRNWSLQLIDKAINIRIANTCMHVHTNIH